MWTRVALLTLGMAFGWGVANYWTVPWAERGKHQYRLTLSAILTGILVAALAWEQPASGIIATGIFAFSALISYAGNAKQVGKEPEGFSGRPSLPEKTLPGYALVIVAQTLPKEYDGPTSWVRLFRANEQNDRWAPHWFVRPFVLSRLRRAYHEMSPMPTSHQSLQELINCLDSEPALPRNTFWAHPWAEPSVADILCDVVSQGFERILIVPIDLSPMLAVDLNQTINETRVREIGVSVETLPTIDADYLTQERLEADLQRLMQGEEPEPPAGLESEKLGQTCNLLKEHVLKTANKMSTR